MLKLQTLNCNGVSRESVIDETKIVGFSEIKHEPQNLYDENGDLVKTENQDSTFRVIFDGGREVQVDKATYGKLVARLKIETL